MELGGLKCIRIFFLAWRQEEVWCCYHRFVFFLENENYCHPDAFIADHKVPRRQFVHFSRLVVKQYSYLCSWILFFGGCLRLLWCLRNEKLMLLRLPWLQSLAAICPLLLVWCSTGWLILDHGSGLLVFVYVFVYACVQLDPVWSHLHKRRLPRNPTRGRNAPRPKKIAQLFFLPYKGIFSFSLVRSMLGKVLKFSSPKLVLTETRGAIMAC